MAQLREAQYGLSRVGAPSPLLERDAELSEIGAALRSAQKGCGRCLMIEGPAGIGKTRLLEDVRRRARRRGMTVLAARGGELERELAFGIVRQLFEAHARQAAPDERERLLAGAASQATPVVDAVEAETVGDATMRVLHGLYWLAANLAAEAPLVLVVDDVHFADPASLKWLAFVTPRLDGVPLLLTVAVRSGEPGPHGELIATVAADASTSLLRPAPLSPQAVAHAVRQTLAKDASPEFCDACFTATAGNPFLVRELLLELTARSGDELSRPERLAQLRPETVARAVIVRLGRLPPSAVELAKAVAVLGDGAELRQAAALAGLELDAAEDAADLLGGADVLAPARPLSFVHPIVRAVIADELRPGGRAAAHARAAKLLEAENAPPPDLAPHLLVTDPGADRWVVDRLREAAEWSFARGAPENAAAYLERALREPPSAAERPAVMFELGRAENRLMVPSAIEHLREAVDTGGSDQDRADALIELVRALFMADRLSEAVDVVERLLSELTEIDAGVAQTLQRDLICNGIFDNHARPRARQRLGQLAETAPDDPAVLAMLAFDGCLIARPAVEVIELAEVALADERLFAYAPNRPEFYFAACSLVFADRYDVARRALSRCLTDARKRGDAAGVAVSLAFQAIAEYRQGRLAEAEVDARSSLEVVGSWTGLAVATLVDALLEHGDWAAAAAAVAGSPAGGTALGNVALNLLVHRKGMLLLAEGRAENALVELLDAGRREREWGVCNPSVLPWRSSAALAYTALGRAREARELVDEELELATRFGAPRAIGVALVAKGLTHHRDGGLERLEEAVCVLQPSGADLELSRALVELGAAHRRRGHRVDARSPLRDGLELAHRCGATVLAERARRELRACGILVRRPARSGVDALTPSERRVAELVADGSTNREAAQMLFVTEKTIETHLASVYRKLSIHSRRQLTVKLGEGSVGESASMKSSVAGP